jgi:hypothetical protein
MVICGYFIGGYWWRVPNSLRDSNVSPKLKTMEEQGVEAQSLAHSILEG